MSLNRKTRRSLAALPTYLLALSTAAIAQTAAPTTGAMPEWIEKGGFAALCAYIVWWMTTKLSASIDKLTDRIGDMIEKQDKRDGEMTAAFRDMTSAFRVQTETLNRFLNKQNED